jgi:hypothetical protein
MPDARTRAQKTSGTFRLGCAITATIHASPERVWGLLTDGAAYVRWNSTVSRLEGDIVEGSTLRLEVPTAPGRVFKPKVSIVEPGRAMTWSDGFAPMFKGVRTFTLTPNRDGSTEFSMKETFSGLMLPMIRGSLPDLAHSFETYAGDLKRAAEDGGG